MASWEPPSNKLEFADVGNALVQGAHARFYDQRANHEAAAEKGRIAAGPDLPAAVGGDQAAIGRVAQNAPDLLGKLAPMLGRLDAHKAAQVKEAAEFSARGANAILQANPADRPALYRQIIADGKARGHVINMPDEYSPQLDGQLRAHRAQAIPVVEWFKQDEMMRRHVTPGARAGGAAEFDAPSWGGKAPAVPGDQHSSLGPALNGGIAPPDVRQATTMPQGEPPVAPPVQQASAAPAPAPPGFKPMGHRRPDGQLVPAMVNGKPVYRGPDGQLTTEPSVQQASAPIYQGTGEPIQQGDGGPPGSPAGSGPPVPEQIAQAPPSAPAGRAPAPSAPGAVVHDIPPGYEPLRQKGIPHVTKQGYIPLISQNGPPLLLKPADTKPTERPLPPEGYTWGPDGGQTFIPGGPADPATIERNAGVKRAANEKAIPQTITKGMQENLDSIKQIDRTLAALAGNEKGVGNTSDYLQRISPQWGGDLNNKVLNPEGTQLRALIADIGSLKVHDRSGAAVTASETPRLIPFIPQITDDAPTIRKKLANFRAVYEQSLLDTAGYYAADNGFKPYKPALDYLEGGAPTATPAKPTATPSNNRPPLSSFEKMR